MTRTLGHRTAGFGNPRFEDNGEGRGRQASGGGEVREFGPLSLQASRAGRKLSLPTWGRARVPPPTAGLPPHPPSRQGHVSMLTLLGDTSSRYCDGVSRRELPQGRRVLVRRGRRSPSPTCSGPRRRRKPGPGTAAARHKAVINIFLGGGPPHQDMWDIKTERPGRDPRRVQADRHQGARHPDRRDVPADRRDGRQVRRSSARSSGPRAGTTRYQCMTGWPTSSRWPRWAAGRASARSSTKLQGHVDPAVPPFVGLAEPTKHLAVERRRPAPASSARPTPRSSRAARTWRTWCSTPANRDQPGRPQAAARRVRRPPPRRSTPTAR